MKEETVMLAEVNDTGMDTIQAFCCPVFMKSIQRQGLVSAVKGSNDK